MKTFSTSMFQFSHGRPPRGRGSWAFAPVGRTNDPSAVVFVHGATFADAKRQMPAGAWVVMP